MQPSPPPPVATLASPRDTSALLEGLSSSDDGGDADDAAQQRQRRQRQAATSTPMTVAVEGSTAGTHGTHSGWMLPRPSPRSAGGSSPTATAGDSGGGGGGGDACGSPKDQTSRLDWGPAGEMSARLAGLLESQRQVSDEPVMICLPMTPTSDQPLLSCSTDGVHHQALHQSPVAPVLSLPPSLPPLSLSRARARARLPAFPGSLISGRVARCAAGCRRVRGGLAAGWGRGGGCVRGSGGGTLRGFRDRRRRTGANGG